MSDVQYRLQVELASAFLEEVLEGLSKQVHNHHVVHLAVVRLLIAYEVQEGNKGLSPHFMDELRLPEEHNVSLHFNCFFLNTTKG